MSQDFDNLDINDDDKLTHEELALSERAMQIERAEEKAESHKKMAWVALFTMVGFVLVMMTEYIALERIKALAEITGMMFITLGGIVATYMGANAWMTKSK